MTQLSDLEFLKLSKGQRFGYKLGRFFTGIPKAILGFFLKIWGVIKKGGAAVGTEIADIVNTLIHGDWKTKLSFFVMGFGNIARGSALRRNTTKSWTPIPPPIMTTPSRFCFTVS